MDENKTRYDFIDKFGVDAFVPGQDGLLYKYFTIDRALELVGDESLWFSAPDKLNDMFELDIDRIQFNVTDESIVSLSERYFPDNNKKREELLNSPHRAVAAKLVQNEFKKLRSECGICCFTTNPRERKMWGLYGKSDSGVCIGFDLPYHILVSPTSFLLKVKYETEFTNIDHFNGDNIRNFTSWVFTKNSDWGYEEEIRMLRIGSQGLLKIPLNSIKEIHYGSRCEENDIGRLESRLALKDYISHKKFRIHRERQSYELLSKPL